VTWRWSGGSSVMVWAARWWFRMDWRWSGGGLVVVLGWRGGGSGVA
jgi:hypothetical protein